MHLERAENEVDPLKISLEEVSLDYPPRYVATSYA
jgi:hypothetical protein